MTTETPQLRLFDRYSYEDVVCSDPSLAPYISLKPLIEPHTANSNNNQKFGKARTNICERLACRLMRNGRNSGKKRLAVKALKTTFIIIEQLTNENPIQVLIDAIINSGIREDSARIGRGGNMKRVSVDVSPSKRICLALKFLTDGTRKSTFKNIRTLPELLADELIAASKNSQNSYAVKKKDELERIAKSNR